MTNKDNKQQITAKKENKQEVSAPTRKDTQVFYGNLGGDPTAFVVQKTEKKAARFSLAVSKGEDETEWYTVMCFDPQYAEVIEGNLKKGSRVRIQGRTQTSFVTIDGKLRQFNEIVMDGPLGIM